MRVRRFKGLRRRRPSEKKKHGQWIITLRGEKGKIPRRILIALAAAAAVLVLLRLMRPEPLVMASAEIGTVWDNGILKVGVRTDVPGMSENEQGLEYELATLLAKRIMNSDPDFNGESAVEIVPVTTMNVAVKLTDGDIDAAICLMPKGAFSGYAYSEAYYTDPLYFIARAGEESRTVDKNTKIGYIQSSSSTSLYVPTSFMYNALSGFIEEHKDEGMTLSGNTVKYASYIELFRALEEGEVDVIVLSGIMSAKFAGEYSFSVCAQRLGSVGYAIACLSDKAAIATVADMMLSEMQSDGSLDALKQKYGFREE